MPQLIPANIDAASAVLSLLCSELICPLPASCVGKSPNILKTNQNALKLWRAGGLSCGVLKSPDGGEVGMEQLGTAGLEDDS